MKRPGNKTNHPVKPLEDRFWLRVNKTDTCWLWTGSKGPHYGRVIIDKRSVQAHRASWILTYGAIPEGQLVLHRCDVPLCVNPDHLFLGTQQENMQDCLLKGRAGVHVHPERRAVGERHGLRLHPEQAARGESHGLTTLTSDQVLQIRQAYPQQSSTTQLARMYQVSRATIRNIVNYRTWRHV